MAVQCVCVCECLRHMPVNLLGIILNMEPLGVARCQNLIFVNIFILSGGSLCHLFNSFIDSIVTGARHVPADRLPGPPSDPPNLRPTDSNKLVRWAHTPATK